MLLAMESFTLLPLPVSQFSSLPPKPHNRITAFPFIPLKQTTSHSTSIQCQKMYVAGYGEASPEKKAAKYLHEFFTYIAVKIVNAQLQSYNREAYADMMKFLEQHSMNDGDKFCADLMRVSSNHKNLALRILEVRSAYCKNDFEWDNLKYLASKIVDESNTRVMRDYVSETSPAEEESEK